VRAGRGEHRVVRTPDELTAAVDESAEPRAIQLYVHESLLDDARRRWETTKQTYRH
jgi:hypothetical protein